MIRHLVVDKEVFPEFEIKDSVNQKICLSGFSKINLFVGPNNSGKSRFLRYLLASDRVKVLANFESETVANFAGAEERLRYALNHMVLPNLGADNGSSFPKIVEALVQPLNASGLEPMWQRCCDFFINFVRKNLEGMPLVASDHSRIRSYLGSITEHFTIPEKTQRTAVKWNRLYIPILRTLRRSSGSKEVSNLPLLRLAQDHHKIENATWTFTGEDIYERIRDLLLGTRSERKLIREFENFIRDAFFPGQEIELVPTKGEKSDLHVKIGSAKDREIYNLGDGIQSILIAMFPLITRPNNPEDFWLVGIEEPESNLHPGFQRLLLSKLAEIENAQFFLTTHSNHFIDAALEREDVSLFHFEATLEDSQEEDRNHRVFVSHSAPGEQAVLENLGVRPSSVLLANCTIWVEGISDRRIYQHYLKLCQEKEKTNFREDLHFAFVEYGGSNVTHYSFADLIDDPINVDRICARALLVADGDNANGKKAERLQSFEEKLGGRFIRLAAKELENLITPGVLAKVLSEREGRQIDADAFPESYARSNMGTVLKKAAGDNPKKSYADSKGNLLKKAEFAQSVVRHTASFDDLSDEAKDIAMKLLKFIQKLNPQ